MDKIQAVDIYTVINKTFLSEENRSILVNLYQPIIGIDAIMLYFSLWNDLDNAKIMSIEYNHEHLISNMHISLKECLEARHKLEAVGLLKSYLKEDKVNYYVYELYSPLSVYEFLNHPILNIVLYSNLGKKEYDFRVSLYKKPKISLTSFKDITSSLDQVFESTPYLELELKNDEVIRENRIKFNINSDFDLDYLKESLAKNLSTKAFTKEIEELIINLSFIYKLDVNAMQNIIRASINERGTISTLELRKTARNYYTFENSGHLPTLIKKESTESKEILDSNNLKRAKMVYTFETISPEDLLKSKMDNGEVPKRDLKLIEDLVLTYKLKPKVVNVLLDYVLKTNNNKLNRALVETIAGQWKRLKIESVVDAMSIAEKEHKKYRKNKESNKVVTKTTEKIPEWFDKNMERKEMTIEEKEEIENLLKEYQS